MNSAFERETALQKRIHVVFSDKGLLHRALVHRSYLNENSGEKRSNERLEFLGDAVLEFVVSDNLFAGFPDKDEGHLTALRSRLVNTTSLAETARELNLGQEIYLSRGEERGQGRENVGLLANTLEAVIGAIFLDKGINEAKKFINRFIVKKIPKIVSKSLKDPKSLLQELVQAKGLAAPVYKTTSQTGPAHSRRFVVAVLIDKKIYAHGRGASKKVATQKAAEAALNIFRKQNR